MQGIDLQPQDPNGKSDPYLKVSIGKKVISDKDNYVTADLNPMFGTMFELPAKLPIDHTLKVTVMDWDRFSADDLIGETKIDLENRFLSQYRPTCGLPETMSRLACVSVSVSVSIEHVTQYQPRCGNVLLTPPRC